MDFIDQTRMVRALFAFIALLLACVLTAFSWDNYQARPRVCGFSGQSGYYTNQGKKRSFIANEASAEDDGTGIYEVVAKMKRTLKFDVPIMIYISKGEGNCYATTSPDNTRMLVADKDFLINTNNTTGTKWAAISVLAHELGHHVAGFDRHPTQAGDELDADYWSGYILNKLGASKTASTKCVLRYGGENDTDTHPNKLTRAEIVQTGWDDAHNNTINYEHCDNCKPEGN
ncbi:hypothetical protein [Hymenobacter sp. GOD-10R]|uniref:hypothetical protein n=1 Tax=Hymenobacter sp. GOD-10R TaxID=3093922 RepID=UPI002D768975|nr:hypothetical protein [Hymenobacter sp. GOD-10R]WRQ32006.1 hypothetical protein SD425_29820 [Hymenobacter sp. GOD-10R]